MNQENSIQLLFEEIPEFKKENNLDEDEIKLPSIVFDAFGTYLLNKIESDPSNPVLKKSFDFLNKLIGTGDEKMQNLAVVGVFEALAGSEKGAELAEKNLAPEGLDWFKKVLANFH